MQWLKQSTAVTIQLGPAVDASDGVSEETGLDAGSPEPTVYVSKNGAAFAARAGTSFAADGFGWYRVGLAAGDVDTLGRLVVMLRDPATHLPVWLGFMVVPANVWDSLFGADRLQVDLREFGDASLALTTQMKTDIQNQVFDKVVENSLTFLQWSRLCGSALLGKLSGAATTTVAIRDTADSKDRISATVDADGNRTAVTLDGS